MKSKISIGIVILLVLIQFIPIKRNERLADESFDISYYYNLPKGSEVSNILKTSCYDCHSNNTSSPWYSKIAPVSWYLANHVNGGKKQLNFSEWKYLDEAKREHKIEEVIEIIQDDEMPLTSYTLLHQDAKLTVEEKENLLRFFESL